MRKLLKGEKNVLRETQTLMDSPPNRLKVMFAL